jgi:hypothetical protein
MFNHKRIVLRLMSAYGMDTHLHDTRYGSKRTNAFITQGKKPSTFHFLDIQAVLARSACMHITLAYYFSRARNPQRSISWTYKPCLHARLACILL